MIIDEIGYLPTNIKVTNLFFQLIAERYDKHSALFATNKNFDKWADIFQDSTISATILDKILHHANVVKIIGDLYILKEIHDY